jgi:FlaA1/EpsC-like NDP-sugar epimerase
MNGSPNSMTPLLERLGSFGARWRHLMICTILVAIIVLSLAASFYIRFEYAIPEAEFQLLLYGLVVALAVKLPVYYLGSLHRGWWSIVGISDLLRIASGTFIAATLFALAASIMIGPSFPRSIYILDALISFVSMSGVRLFIRIYKESQRPGVDRRQTRHVLIYGEPWAAATVARDLENYPNLGYRVVGFLDDNPNKRNERVMDMPVFGSCKDLQKIVDKLQKKGIHVDELIYAMPSATSGQMRQTLQYCRAAGLPCKTLPSITDLLGSKGLALQIRDISVEDLLARAPVNLDSAPVRALLQGKRTLVTGGAGFIGSELCRQIAAMEPGCLVVFDQAESELFRIDLELRSRYPSANIVPCLADVRDPEIVRTVISQYGIEVIFHAAAYKHVPMLEAHPLQAAENNVIGTSNLLQAACDFGVQRFVLISSDKAVNPTSVMGASKRAAELLVACAGESGEGGVLKFVSVRFGNVLASTGSVIPVFQAQIGRGGPVTVTHPDMRRYFMVVREAAQLVLQAAALATGRETFVLDMGDPVHIVDLARTMIQLAGLVPERDVKIEFTGLRPGEKLFEELRIAGERFLPTPNPKIKIFQQMPVKPIEIEAWLAELRDDIAAGLSDAIPAHLARLVPEYTPDVLDRSRASNASGPFPGQVAPVEQL